MRFCILQAVKQGQEAVGFAPSSLILTNYFLPVNRALVSMNRHAKSWICTALAIAVSSLAGCDDNSTTSIRSPSGYYGISASVEVSDTRNPDYGIVMLHLEHTYGKEASFMRTGASTFQEWSLGWMPKEDIVVLCSSDIGTIAYQVMNRRLVPLPEITPEIQGRSNELCLEEYGVAAPST